MIRDGRQQEIAAADVVPGDALVLAEGDLVAADAELWSPRLCWWTSPA